MRTISWWLMATLAVASLSCSGGNKGPTAPAGDLPDDINNTALPGGDTLPGEVGMAGLGGYTVEVDVDTLSATTTMWRQGAQTDDIYFLSVDNFLRPNSLSVDSISVTPTTVNLNYTFTHPFQGPANLSAPATAANRADLGIAARLLFLADVPAATGNTYFGSAVANTDLLVNADGFYQPNGLLTSTSGMTANTFPYKLVVDEGAGSDGNRVGVANGGTAEGNYRVDLDGWQSGNIIGPNGNNGWTGFGVLHQGQAATNTLQLDRPTLAGGDFTLNVAVIAKYIDPRGGANATQKRANRLPKNPSDVRLFVYRMPFGAIDAELVRSQGETGGLLPNNLISSTTVSFNVRDWDARATESSEVDLNDELNPSLVPTGTSGVPVVTVDIPGVTTLPASLALVDDDTAFGGDVGADSGVANDSLFYQGVVQNTEGGGTGQTAGPKNGMVRVVDPEDGIDRSAYEFALDPSLTPLASNKPEIVTYQGLRVSMGGGPINDPPSVNLSLAGGTNPTIASGGTVDVMLDSEFDTESDPVTYEIDVTNDGTPEAPYFDPPTGAPPSISIYTATVPVNLTAVPVNYQLEVLYKDPSHPATPVLLDYVVAPQGPNSPPTATVTLAATTIASGGDITYNLDAENDPDGDAVTYQIDYNFTGVFAADTGVINPPGSSPPPSIVLHTSTPQVNPGGTVLNRSTVIRYTDGINPAIDITLTYDLGPQTCSNKSMLWNFDTDMGGWSLGPDFTFGLPNGDDFSWGHFRRACNVSETEGRVGAANLSGGYITSGDDGDDSSCSFLYDYGPAASYNMVSPFINVPDICLPNTLNVVFDAVLFARSTGTANLYLSTDFGATWGTPIWTQVATQDTEMILANTTVALPDSHEMTTIMLRFEYIDTNTTTTYALPAGFNNNNNSVALTLDNIEISAGATGPFTNTPPTLPCAPRTRVYDFTTAQGWQGGQLHGLPNGDLNGFGTPNAGGWSSLRPTTCDNASDPTYAAVTAAYPLISGPSINGTDDGTGSACGGFYLRDYAGNAHWNVVSPRILVPPACAGDDVSLSWQAYLNTDDSNYADPTWEPGGEDGRDDTVVVNAYLSIDNGATWGTPVWTANTATIPGGQTFNVTIPDLDSLAGLASGVRVRFQFQSSRGTTQSDAVGDPFGFYIDNVTFSSVNTNGIYTTF